MKTLPVALCVEDQIVVIVGASADAACRAARWADAEAVVRVFANVGSAEMSALARARRVEWFARRMELSDLSGARIVLLAEKDENVGAMLRRHRRRMGYFLCAVDQPALCDFTQVGSVSAGPVQIAISSNGTAPALVRRLREELERCLRDAAFPKFASEVAARREDLRVGRSPIGDGARAVLDGFELNVTVRYPTWFG